MPPYKDSDVTQPFLYLFVKSEAPGAGANAASLATSVAVSSSLSFDSDPGILCLRKALVKLDNLQVG